MPVEYKTYKITKIMDETPDVKTVQLSPRAIDFEPGQFIMIKFPKIPKLGARAFSMTSKPSDKFLEIGIKVKGEFTSTLAKQKVGDELLVAGPYGFFTLKDDPETAPAAMIAGGIGITPFMSILRTATEKTSPRKFVLLFANKTQADIAYHKDIEALAAKNKNIKVVYVLSRESPEGWEGELGHINADMIKKYAPDDGKQIYMVCGSPGFVEALTGVVAEMGINKERIRKELFTGVVE